ncbi:MAG TPA: DNA topology modulation protein [Pyrinomonadaceae bacterium]|jgi:adenylate kinase family enzyme|nr:DNA topology modulation protein [Pyrinomonadaceae bacterium]
MKRVLVIGSGGAGKSTLAARLGEATGIEVIHLDKLHWLPGWVEPDKEKWHREIYEMLKGDSWIIDGNYGSTLERRMAAADTVIFLDFPRTVCVWRVFKRVVRYRNINRPDMAEGCNEKFDLKFFKWIWDYPNRTKPRIEALLNDLRDKINIIRLRSTKEVENFIGNISR